MYDLKSHCHVCGSSQSGKSKFCEWCIREHIIRGNGFALIDWHGTLYQGVLDYLAYQRPKNPVYILNPSQPDWITPFNPFALPAGANVSAHAARMAKTLVKSWGEDIARLPTFQRVAQAIFTFCAVTGEPLQHGVQLLAQDAEPVRQWAIEQVKEHGAAQSTLMQISQASKRFSDWNGLVGSLENRLNTFTGSQGLTRFIGLPQKSVSIADCIREKAIVLINLTESYDLDQEAAKAFAAVVLSEFLFAAKQNAKKELPYYLYADEAANYLTADAASMLDESLKFGMRLTVISHHGNQAAFQKHPEIRDSLEMNARIKVIFAGMPPEVAKRNVEECFPDEVNEESIRRINTRTITVHEQELSETENENEGGYANEFDAGESWNVGKSRKVIYAPRQEEEISGYDVWSRDEKISRLASRFLSLQTGECIIKTPKEVFWLPVHEIEDYGLLQNPARIVEFLHTLRSNQISKNDADEIIKSEATRFAERSRNAPRTRGKKKPPNLCPQG